MALKVNDVITIDFGSSKGDKKSHYIEYTKMLSKQILRNV